MRLLGVLRENALGSHDITYAGHYEKSLCSDDDPGKMKIISLDWIALSCRLLIRNKALSFFVNVEIYEIERRIVLLTGVSFLLVVLLICLLWSYCFLPYFCIVTIYNLTSCIIKMDTWIYNFRKYL